MLSAVARPFVAATLMLLVVQGLDTANIGPIAAMAIKLPVGAAIFGIAVIALWLGQGGPDGAEKILIAMLRQRSRQFLIKHFARM